MGTGIGRVEVDVNTEDVSNWEKSGGKEPTSWRSYLYFRPDVVGRIRPSVLFVVTEGIQTQRVGIPVM